MKIVIISGSRSDWNCLSPVAVELKARGHGVEVIATDGQRDSMAADFDGNIFGLGYPGGNERWEVVHAASGIIGMLNSCLRTMEPGIAVLGGDRWEILAAAFACSLRGIPICHLCGGDTTLGSADDRYRDAITALAQLHCTSTEIASERVQWLLGRRSGCRFECTGSPAIDKIIRTPLLSADEAYQQFGLSVGAHEIIVAVHPDTVLADPLHECRVMLSALNDLGAGFNFACLGANNDAGGDRINAALEAFCIQHPGSSFRSNVEPRLLYSLMAHCDCMVGNSSAAYYEAPSFGLPCVNVGDRQRGRIVPSNVIEAKVDKEAIAVAIKMALAGRISCLNPYGDGHAAQRIAGAIEAFMRVSAGGN